MKFHLGDIASIRSGYSFRSGVSLNLEGGLPILQMGDLDDSGCVEKQLQRVLLKQVREDYFLKRGDVLIRGRGYNLRATLLNDYLEGALFAAPLLRIRIKSEGVLPGYLVWHLNQAYKQQSLKRFSRGTSVKMLTIEALETLDVFIPSRQMQERIAIIAELIKKEQQLLEQIQTKRAQITEAQLQWLRKEET